MPALPWRAWAEAIWSLPQTVMAVTRGPSRQAERENRWRMDLETSSNEWATQLGNSRVGMPTREANMRIWLRFCAWSQCAECGVWHQRPLRQAELSNPVRARAKIVSPLCDCCRVNSAERSRSVPKLASWPVALRNRPEHANRCLRPFVVHQGSPKKHPSGYRRKDGVTGFSWKSESIQSGFQAETPEIRGPLQDAYAWLLENNVAYASYVQAHNAWLQSDGASRSLQPPTLLEPFLECALFPVLYWDVELAESKRSGERIGLFLSRSTAKILPVESLGKHASWRNSAARSAITH
jgi:hypothetical protein